MTRAKSRTAQVPAGIQRPRLILLLAVLALTLIGLVMIYSASSIESIHEGGGAADYVFDQLKFALIGIVAAFILWKIIPLDAWNGPLLWGVWGAGVLLLILTWIMGTAALGAQRWLQLGPIGLQPSEFAKVAFVLVAAKTFEDFRTGSISISRTVVQTLMVLVPTMFLYVTQSDLGTTVIIAVGILAVLWLGEMPKGVIVGIIVAGALFVLFAIFGTGYRSDRMIYLNPWDDGEGGYGAGYQIIHSFFALSEGGLFGVGLGNSHEKYLYLPEAETDFIFAIIGEETGLFGALVVIALFLALLYAGLRIAQSASSSFGTMLAGGLSIMIVFQAFLNIGFVIGAFPTTGKPLPFISSGGSSIIATFIMIGLILEVSEDAASPSIYERRRADLRVVRVADGGAGRSGTGAPESAAPRSGRSGSGDCGARGSRGPGRSATARSSGSAAGPGRSVRTSRR